MNTKEITPNFLNDKFKGDTRLSFFPNEEVLLLDIDLTSRQLLSKLKQVENNSTGIGIDFYFNRKNFTSTEGILFIILFSNQTVLIASRTVTNSIDEINLPESFVNFFSNKRTFGVLSPIKQKFLKKVGIISNSYHDLIGDIQFADFLSLDLRSVLSKQFNHLSFNDTIEIPPPEAVYTFPLSNSSAISLSFPIIGWSRIFIHFIDPSKKLPNPPPSPVEFHVGSESIKSDLGKLSRSKAKKKNNTDFVYRPESDEENEQVAKVPIQIEKKIPSSEGSEPQASTKAKNSNRKGNPPRRGDQSQFIYRPE